MSGWEVVSTPEWKDTGLKICTNHAPATVMYKDEHCPMCVLEARSRKLKLGRLMFKCFMMANIRSVQSVNFFGGQDYRRKHSAKRWAGLAEACKTELSK